MFIHPMLATVGKLPTGPEWAYEFKWDGVRCIANGGRLFSRAGGDLTAAFPELNMPDGVVLDGELLAIGIDGRPSFAQLIDRITLSPAKAAHLARTTPVTYMVFDVLRLHGRDLTELPYHQRRKILEGLGNAAPHCVVTPSLTNGAATVAAAGDHALEGVVAKRLNSTYRPGQRSPDWIKVKPNVTGDFVVGGWRPGARRIGGLLLGLPCSDGLRFVGRVGTGISVAVEQELLATLEPLRTNGSPFRTVPLQDVRGATWTKPSVVVEVRYDRIMPNGRLRFPRLVRLRPDKTEFDL